MAVIVELRSRGGQLLDRVHTDADSLAVGRAFDNDIIVDDAFVCPHHLRLVRCSDGWQVIDLGSLNGFQVKSKGKWVDRDVVQQGDKLIIGQVVLSVYEETYQVAPALQAHGSESILAGFGRWYAWPFLVLAALMISFISSYLNLSVEVVMGALFAVVVSEFTILLVIVGGWALASRIFRHQAKFLSYLGLWSAFALLSRFFEWGVDLVAYNASSRLVGLVLHNLTEIILLSAVIWGSLSMATNLRSRGRLGAAVAVSIVFTALQLLSTVQFGSTFSEKPNYQGSVALPDLLFVSPVTEEEFMLSVDRIFEEAGEIRDDVDD